MYFLVAKLIPFLFMLYQDLQKGLDLGLVSPDILQNFFDLEKYPLISELTHRFQVNVACGYQFVYVNQANI